MICIKKIDPPARFPKYFKVSPFAKCHLIFYICLDATTSDEVYASKFYIGTLPQYKNHFGHWPTDYKDITWNNA